MHNLCRTVQEVPDSSLELSNQNGLDSNAEASLFASVLCMGVESSLASLSLFSARKIKLKGRRSVEGGGCGMPQAGRERSVDSSAFVVAPRQACRLVGAWHVAALRRQKPPLSAGPLGVTTGCLRL